MRAENETLLISSAQNSVGRESLLRKHLLNDEWLSLRSPGPGHCHDLLHESRTFFLIDLLSLFPFNSLHRATEMIFEQLNEIISTPSINPSSGAPYT